LIAGDYYVATASFGLPLARAGLSGQVALALDEANADGPSPIDACSPIVNVSEITGNNPILVDWPERGSGWGLGTIMWGLRTSFCKVIVLKFATSDEVW
jgi:hypothetical protein